MSHNYRYRGQPLDSSLRSDPGSYSSSGRPHTSPDHDFTRAPQESYSSSHQLLSSPSTSVSRWSQESAFSVLSSCGLEPSDLALLAEMPEDALTVESLPHVLRQIKGKRGTVKPYLQGSPSPSSSSSSCPPSSTHRPATSPPTSHWDHPRSHTLQYSTDQVKPPPAELDRWGNPITLSCAKTQPSSSSSPSSYVVDFHHRSGLSEYGKTCRDPSPLSSQNYLHKSGTPDRSSHQVPSQDSHHRPGASKFSETSRNAASASTENYHYRPGPPEYGNTGRDVGPSSSQNQPSFSIAGRDQTTRPSCSSQHGLVVYPLPPPAQESHHRLSFGGSRSETSSTRSSSSSQSAASMPSRQNALDFHGVKPQIYPYSCSLCAITVMSEKVWLKHINGPHHADGQLSLLQRFPNWDCRMETVDRANNQPGQQRDEENPIKKPQTANQSSNPLQPNTKTQKKILEKSKVVCVKFPAHAVDEAYLRKLAEPFGKVIKILMFPSLAFVELGSIDQARDMVKFHTNYPPTVNGELMEFRISNTFNFLQSSSVVSFFPTPSGEDGKSDLIGIIKRFGSPLYTLFLPSRAFVEMKDAAAAQKIVDYYSSNNLRINDDVIKVSFSGEYKSLMRVPSAKRYREETTTTSKTLERKRRRSRSRSRSSSSSEEYSPRERRSRTRSKSKENSTKERRSRSRSRAEASRVSSRSRDRSKSKDRSPKGRKSASREKSAEWVGKERRSRSKSRSMEKTVVPKKTEASAVSTESSSDPLPVRDAPEAAEREHVQEETESSDDESDIEGMEVIGEDGESVQDEEVETEDEAGDDEEEKKERPAERAHSPEGDNKETKDEEDGHHEQPEEEEEEEEETKPAGKAEREPDFPLNLDSCITLDELKEDDSDDPDEDSRYEPNSPSRRVLYFTNVPLDVFTDAEFIQLVRDYGTAVLFLRVPGRRTGFIEMSSSAEARRVKDALTARPLCVRGCRIFVQISSNYPRLINGCSVKTIENRKEEKESESRSRSSRRSERLSNTSDRDGSRRKSSSRRSQERESKTSHRKSVERESTPRKSSEKKSPEKKSERLSRTTPENESANEKTPENESANEKTPENESTNEKTPEKESANEKTSEKESTNEKTPENESTNEKTPENELTNEKTSENESANEKTSENESTNEKTPENESTNEKTSVNESTNEKTPENESTNEKTPENKSTNEKTSENESTNEKTSVNESTNEKTPENESTNEKTPENESTNEKTSVNESTNEKTPEKALANEKTSVNEFTNEETPENESTNEESSERASASRLPAEESQDEKNLEKEPKQSSRTDPEETPQTDLKTSAETNPAPVQSPEEEPSEKRTLKRRGTHEDDSVPKKKEKESQETQIKDAEASGEETSEIQERTESLKSPDQPDSTGDPPRPQTEELCDSLKPADQLEDSEIREGPGSEPESGAEEQQKPLRPVGAEFVHPVVGYFCDLCQVIYASEDEAKQQHCSSEEHYRKYQEKTGKDPWAS